MFYAGNDEFMDGTLAFIREGVAAGEPILVVLDMAKIDALAHELRQDADRVVFADMSEVGANPARIIPAWQSFVAQHSRPRQRLRGIGEPIWSTRSPAELAECQRHEALLNLAFDDPDFWLLCPYDITTLDDAVIAAAHTNHPYVRIGSIPSASEEYRGADAFAAPFDEPLPDPPRVAELLTFNASLTSVVRALVSEHAARAGLRRDRAADFTFAVHEIATNCIRHANGRGTLRIWREADAVVCEVRGVGRIADPLVGRTCPERYAESGRGLWLANHLCDLVQIRSFATETAVRLRMTVG